jgi:tetratricopeptide (TPR) repeat protein
MKLNIIQILVLLALSLHAQPVLNQSEAPVSYSAKQFEQMFQSGLAYYRDGNYKTALDIFTNIRSLSPRFNQLHSYITECRNQLGYWVETPDEQFAQWKHLTLNPGNRLQPELPDSLFRFAENLMSQGRRFAAFQILATLVEQEPENEIYQERYSYYRRKLEDTRHLFTRLGNEFFILGDYKNALHEWYKALYYNPGDPYLQSRISDAETRLKELRLFYVESLKESQKTREVWQEYRLVESAYRDFPYDPYFKNKYDSLVVFRKEILKARISEGSNLVKGERYEEAWIHFAELIRDYPGLPELLEWQNQVHDYLSSKTSGQSLKILNKQLAKAVEQKDHLIISRLLKEIDNSIPDTLRTDANYKLPIDPETEFRLRQLFKTHLIAARDYLSKNRISSAWTSVANASKIFPDDPELINTRRQIKSREDQIIANHLPRIQKAEELIRIKKHNDAAKINLSYSGVPELDARVQSIKNTLRNQKTVLPTMDPNELQQLFESGIRLYRMGEYEEAAEIWKQVLYLDPEHLQAKQYLENVTNKVNQLE